MMRVSERADTSVMGKRELLSWLNGLLKVICNIFSLMYKQLKILAVARHFANCLTFSIMALYACIR